MQGLLVDCGDCPYLPPHRFLAFHPLPGPATDAAVQYRQLMDLRFRRSGEQLYRPVCPTCEACQPVRVDVAAFKPRRDQQRCLGRNRDLAVTWQARGLDDERRRLFGRYQHSVHGKPDDDPESLAADGGIPGGELHARDATGRLLAVSVVDAVGDAFSSVYCYYDSDQPRRSLGTFMVLAEIERCRVLGLPWLYLGFLVRGCPKMEYKARFRPQEVLEKTGWVRYP